MPWTRLYTLVFALAGALVLAACADSPTAHLCTSGILCPDPLQCAAVQAVCITNNCGNGKVDEGENCDDGNIVDGDGCSADCHSQEHCGDGVVNAAAGEICDDGNTIDGDGCAANCRSVEICGNGIVDASRGEVCDDGNTVSGDGCSSNCKSREVCGNNIVDFGEQCDDGNTISGDACESDCKSGAGCGNGIIDPNEECDDGNLIQTDDCHNCHINVCGDGVRDTTGLHLEDCDPSTTGKAIETALCNLDCTTRSCGDGKVNKTAGEECDNIGLNANDHDCTLNCKLNKCGDGLANTAGPSNTEQCDDGNLIETDGCTNSCTLPSCGNGLVDMGEECDLGTTNGVSNNGLTSACPACKIAKCGDNHVQTNVEACDPGAPGVNTAACNRDCTLASCGDGKLNHNFTPTGAADGEECDPPNAAEGCSALCQLAHCGNGVVDAGEACDNGASNSVNGPCLPWCQLATCGDGRVESASNNTPPTEQCDLAASNGVTACSYGTLSCTVCTAACQTAAGTPAYCGDTQVTNGETCDPGAVGVDTNLCNRDCTAPSCGDGKVNHNFTPTGAAGPEQCDPPDATKGCSAKCQLVHCGNGVVDTGEGCDSGAANSLNGPCLPWCQLAVCGDGRVESSSTSTPATEQCDNGAANGTTACPYGAASCSVCTANCQTAAGTTSRCGDGTVDGARGEACDAGASNGTPCTYIGGAGVTSNSCTGCSSTCASVTVVGPFCGDGQVTNGETCDQGSLNGTPCPYATSCSRCNSTCMALATVSGPSCGNGIVDTGENCDDSNATQNKIACAYGTQTCTACHSCTTVNLVGPYCGNNAIELGNGETCEPPSSSTCNTICQAVTCTDTFKNGLETDTDCGGTTCVGQGRTCANTKLCGINADCTSGYCTAGGVCATATCSDTVKNGLETDTDCGGTTCVAQSKTCANAKMCAINADCTSGYCNGSGVCATPTCTDNARNGLETDVDCGGSMCAACVSGKNCIIPGDCQSGVCTTNVCQVPSCSDLVKNGGETDTDCGGTTCVGLGFTCATGKGCQLNSDCTSGVCASFVCT